MTLNTSNGLEALEVKGNYSTSVENAMKNTKNNINNLLYFESETFKILREEAMKKISSDTLITTIQSRYVDNKYLTEIMDKIDSSFDGNTINFDLSNLIESELIYISSIEIDEVTQ